MKRGLSRRHFNSDDNDVITAMGHPTEIQDTDFYKERFKVQGNFIISQGAV